MKKSRKIAGVSFFLVVIAICLMVGREVKIKQQIGEDLKLNLFWGNIITYHDNHGHIWHNDGTTTAVIRFSNQAAETIQTQIEQNRLVWEAFPLPTRVQSFAYEKAYTWDTPATFVEMADLPRIEHGYWFFVDQDQYRNGALLYGYKALEKLEQVEETKGWSEPGAYALALYDLDTNTLYYYQRNI